MATKWVEMQCDRGRRYASIASGADLPVVVTPHAGRNVCVGWVRVGSDDRAPLWPKLRFDRLPPRGRIAGWFSPPRGETVSGADVSRQGGARAVCVVSAFVIPSVPQPSPPPLVSPDRPHRPASIVARPARDVGVQGANADRRVGAGDRRHRGAGVVADASSTRSTGCRLGHHPRAATTPTR